MKQTKIKMIDLELGQIAFSKPVAEWTVPHYLEALLDKIFEELKRVYWNVYQEEFEEWMPTKMPKLIVRSFYWGDDRDEALKPNFEYKDVRFYWYKHRGRSMTVNVMKTEKQWISWFQKCLKYIRKFEKDI